MIRVEIGQIWEKDSKFYLVYDAAEGDDLVTAVTVRHNGGDEFEETGGTHFWVRRDFDGMKYVGKFKGWKGDTRG